MTYGSRHSDKCSDKELKEFKQDVYNYLNDLNFILEVKMNWTDLRAFNCFGGQVKIYTGRTFERMPLKLRRRLVAFKNSEGIIEGENQEVINKLKENGGCQLWERHSEFIKELECFSVFRTEWFSQDKETADDERKQLKEFLLNHQNQ